MRSFLEFLEMNRRLVVAVAVGSIMIMGLQLFVHNASKECIGIADTKETVISFEVPVLVKRVYVLPGQVVKKGQPLLEVEVPETKLKLLEVQTMLESLESEQDVRNVLLDSFTDKKSQKKVGRKSPISQEIAGLRRQLAELQNQQSQAVRYAEADGVVATVAFGPREQAAPFSPIMTLTPFVPNYAYGFINEKVNSELKVGETVIIEPLNDRTRAATGRVISIGARITAFTDRLQMVNTTVHGNSKGGNSSASNLTPMYFGRELVVSIEPKNQIVIGEKVQIRAREQSHFSELGFQAFADSTSGTPSITSELLATGLPLEASGLIEIPGQNALLSVSDEEGPNGSPFWKFFGEGMKEFINLPIRGIKKIDDVESVSFTNGSFYALGSMSKNASGVVKKARNLIVRFALDGDTVSVDRSFELRTPLIAALQAMPVLQLIHSQLEGIEVESLAAHGDDAFIALKEPQMPDGSSIILKLPGFIRQLNEGTVTAVLVDMHAIIRLDNGTCDNPARVTDLYKTPAGLVILGNCKKGEKMGHVWWMADNAPNHEMTAVTLIRNGNPEGMALNAELNTIYLTSDNGKQKGADLMKITIPVPLQ